MIIVKRVCLKGRYIGENIRTIIETIDKLNETNEPGLVFFADFEKAFDSIDHNFILKYLNYFNFENSFVEWVKRFYNDLPCYVVNNGYVSDTFEVKRGVRQGCPLSPYFFILAIEILYNAVRNETNIEGLVISNKEI